MTRAPSSLGHKASDFKIGDKKRGADGNMWVVKKRVTGAKYWSATVKKSSTKKYKRGSCAKLPKGHCDREPNCTWKKSHMRSGKRTPAKCTKRSGVKAGNMYQGPLPFHVEK